MIHQNTTLIEMNKPMLSSASYFETGPNGTCGYDKYSADSEHHYEENGVITNEHTYHMILRVYAGDSSPYPTSCQ